MDWGKAKTILILSFLSLNILLGYQLWASKINVDKSNQSEAEIIESIQQMMREKSITIDAPIPTSVPKLREIIVRFDITMTPNNVNQLNPSVDLEILKSKSGLKDSLSDQIPKAESYQIDPIAEKSGIMVLNQLYGDLPMFEVNLLLYHKNEKIDAYWQNHVTVQQGSVASEQKIISAFTAVGRLVENLLENGTVIKDIRLGYHGQIFNSETMVLAPSWRVTTSTGDPYYVYAINGDIEPPQKAKEE